MDIKDHVKAHGATIVAIGSGTAEQAREFAEQLHFEGEVYLDPQLKTYQAFGLKRGFFKTLGPRSLALGFCALKKGFRQGKNAGDLWQQGGIFVIGPGNQIVFAHRNRFAGDHADLGAVTAACPIQ